MKYIKVVYRFSTDDPEFSSDVCEIVIYDETGWPIKKSEDPDRYEQGKMEGFVMGLKKAFRNLEVDYEERADYLV